MELNENLERRRRCELPVSEREVAIPSASGRLQRCRYLML